MSAKEFFKQIFKEQYRSTRREKPNGRYINLKNIYESWFMYNVREEAMTEVDVEEGWTPHE